MEDHSHSSSRPLDRRQVLQPGRSNGSMLYDAESLKSRMKGKSNPQVGADSC